VLQPKKFTTLLLITIASLLSVSNIAFSESQSEGAPVVSETTVTFPVMSREFLDHFFDSLRARTVFSPPPLQVSQVVDANTSGIWAGTKTTVETDLQEVVLRFKPTDEARLERANDKKGTRPLLAEYFDLTLQVTPRKLTIIHPLAEGKVTRRGITAEYTPYKSSPSRTEFVGGFRDAGMYFSVPAMGSVDVQKAWGILVCPRELVIAPPKGGLPSRIELHPSPYEVGEVRMTWAGQTEASFPAGSKKERVAVDLALSSQIPRSLEHRDEVTGLSPMVPLIYKPLNPFSFFRMPHDGAVQEGMLNIIEMQNFAGHVRRQFFSHVGYVKRIDEPSPVSVIVRANRVVRDEGACYVVAAQRSVWSRFDKKSPLS
jgi:hypothetical protein